MSKRDDERRIERPVAVPAQEDEADIVEELGAEQDENGEFQASVEDVRKAGAIDIETIRRNRQMENVAKKKQKGEKVSISSNDVLVKYEGLLKTWPTSTMHVKLRRLSGGPEVTELITSYPRSATELYDEIRAKHGQCGEATYEVEFFDASSKEWRGRAKITMPDTRPTYAQGQHMPPPGYQYPPQQPPQQQPPSNGHAASPPVQQSPFALLQEALDTVQRLQGMQSQPSQPQPQPQPPTVAPGTASPFSLLQEALDTVQRLQGMQPPQTSHPTAVASGAAASPFSLLQEALDTVQRLQGMHPMHPTVSPSQPSTQPQLNEALQLVEALQRVARGAQPQIRGPHPQVSQEPNPMTAGPNVPPPAGMMWGWIQGFGFALVPDTTFASGGGGVAQGPMYRGGQRPAYYPNQGDPNSNSNGRPPYMPQQRQMSPTDQLSEAFTVVQRTVQQVERLQDLGIGFGGGRQQDEPAATPVQDDDSPVEIIDMGGAKAVINKSDGSTRYLESVMANSDKIFKWVGEQVEAARKSQERKRQPQQLPEGYVEVGPGFKPPPGYKAVIVEAVQEEELPPPPAEVPPPLQPTTSVHAPWNMPTSPEREE